MKIIDFIMIALVLFIIIKVYSGFKNAANKRIKQTEKLIGKFRKDGMSEQEAKKKAEEQIAAEQSALQEQAEPHKPTTEELLAEIRDILKKK